MSSYRDYSNDLLLALYRIHKEKGPDKYVKFADIHATAGIDVDNFYLPRFTEEWQDYYVELSKHLGPHASWSAKMRPYGYNYVEEELLSLSDEDDETSSGSIILSDEIVGEIIPASDRMVAFDHNSQDFRKIADGLANLREELRSTNDLPCSDSEKNRLLVSMDAAQRLWEAAQLKIIQIKVGIILTIEDVTSVLQMVGKAVGVGLLVDAIKSLVKHVTGIDL